MKDEIYNAGRYQDIDKLCPPGEPEGRVNPDSQGGGFFRPFLVVNARFDKKLIFSGRNVPECHAIVFIDCVPRISSPFSIYTYSTWIDQSSFVR